MGDVVELKTGKGHYMAMFHDDQRFFAKDGRSVKELPIALTGDRHQALYLPDVTNFL